MTELIEQRLNHLLINLFFIVIIISSCNIGNKSNKKPILECLLDSYISTFSIEDKAIIFVSDTQGWSDSTSIIRINSFLKSRNFPHNDILQSNYKGIEIHLEQGEILAGKLIKDKLDIKKCIPNNLPWKKLPSKKNHLEDPAIPEEFDEVQFIYNHSKLCIEEVLTNSDKIKLTFQDFCKTCPMF